MRKSTKPLTKEEVIRRLTIITNKMKEKWVTSEDEAFFTSKGISNRAFYSTVRKFCITKNLIKEKPDLLNEKFEVDDEFYKAFDKYAKEKGKESYHRNKKEDKPVKKIKHFLTALKNIPASQTFSRESYSEFSNNFSIAKKISDYLITSNKVKINNGRCEVIMKITENEIKKTINDLEQEKTKDCNKNVETKNELVWQKKLDFIWRKEDENGKKLDELIAKINTILE